jgi:hypothetical protein
LANGDSLRLGVWDFLFAWLTWRSERWSPAAIRRLTVLYVILGAAASLVFVALLLWLLA